MNGRKLFMFSFVTVCILAVVTQGFSQAQPVQNRIPQQIVINGQPVNGVYVATPGGMQSFTCSSPQQYVTPDNSSQGWACYEQATGTWLLNAVPPVAQAPAPVQVQPQPTVVYQQPQMIYQQPPVTVVYAAPSYPVVVAPVYRPSVVLGAAAIHAAGRIASAALIRPHYLNRGYYISHQPRQVYYRSYGSHGSYGSYGRHRGR